MALSGNRVLMCGYSPFPYEQAAIEFAKQALPDTDPHRLWALVDLAHPDGRRYDIDLLVLGRHALYLVEIKSYPGQIRGNTVDWTVTFPGGRPVVYENPMRLANLKAKVLASLLEKRLGSRRPYVQPLIFLSEPGVDINALDRAARIGVVKREGFARAITHADFPGADERLQNHAIDTPTAREIQQALRAIGVMESKAPRKVGQNVLGPVLEDGPGYQDRAAHHERVPERKSRVRAYLLPQATTQERRDQLSRAAEREARLLTMLGDHRSILRVLEYHHETQLGCPCIVFEHWEQVWDLGTYLRHHPQLSFAQRVDILQQIAEALAYCHRKRIYHRGLHPGAVLVRETGEGDLQVRLYNFQLAWHDGSQGTVHLSALSADPAVLYRAPEVIENPTLATELSDAFSLGALAYFVLTGQHPGADLRERKALLDAAGGRLSVIAARDDLASLIPDHKSLDEIIGHAAHENPLERLPIQDWLGLFLEHATAPALRPTVHLDPLAAKPGDTLGELAVERVLGSGSTARVLRVRRDDATYALKIALSADLEDRLQAEAEALRRLDHNRIVSLIQPLRLGEPQRSCLLLSDAGETLAELLAREGPLTLDYAQRWGEDLLQALGEMEEKGVQHRDIKPANLGVLTGASKRPRHLLLFDFSLAGADPRHTTCGTPAYRDPFVPLRGCWDEAADRWAAAVTLYEMLTGLRPRFGDGDISATAAGQEAVIEADRFDASVRGRLWAFFRKALHRDVSVRHASAAAMRAEWMACFTEATLSEGAPKPASSQPASAETETQIQQAPPQGEATVDNITLDTPVAALPLSARAKNALDRSGVMAVRDLLNLPQNQLSLIRGVGRETSLEILRCLQRCRAALPAAAAPAEPPFAAGYRGPDSAVSFIAGLTPAARSTLEDAGLSHLNRIAAASRVWVERLLRHHPNALLVLRQTLQGQKQGAELAPVPPTIEAWLEALVPASGTRGETYLQKARVLLGLDAVGGVFCHDAPSAAQALKVSRQMVYASLNQARQRWRNHPHIAVLAQQIQAALDGLGGVASLRRLADALCAAIPHDSGAKDDPHADRRTQALLHMVGLLGDERGSTQLHLGRLHDALWLGLSRDHLDHAGRLGECADQLAGREPLPSSAEVREALGEVVRDTVLSGLSQERLVTLAAEASRHAAPSARLELYPRGMPADRALRLSAGALSGDELREGEIGQVISARYPEAAQLPARPALDELLSSLHLTWSEDRKVYVRPPLQPGLTSYSPLGSRRTTVHGPPRPTTDPEQQEAREFEERLQLLVRRRYYRVLRVSIKLAEAAVRQLSRRLQVSPISLDQELLREAQALMRERGIEPQTVFQADREGPANAEDWTYLCELMRDAAERLADRILKTRDLVVLIQPGLLARYHLTGFLGRLMTAEEQDDGPAILLVVPSYEEGGPAVIHAPQGSLAVPTGSLVPPLWVPESWVLNVHRGDVRQPAQG